MMTTNKFRELKREKRTMGTEDKSMELMPSPMQTLGNMDDHTWLISCTSLT